MAKTMIKLRAASVNADRHNNREKLLGHTRPELQPKDTSKWMWEADDKTSVYLMRKRAEKEFHDVEVVVKGKHGNYTTHKTLPKNAQPVKEGVVKIKPDTTMADLQRLADLLEKKYGIRAVGIYIHLDEGHWNILKDGQTEDMYRREDGHEWKRQNELGEWEYWKPNYHAHMVFDCFNHRTGRCIEVTPEATSAMQKDSADALGMERGTPKAQSGVQGLDTWDYKRKMETERLTEKMERGKKKVEELDAHISSKKRQLNSLEAEEWQLNKKIKSLNTMIENLTNTRNGILREIKNLKEEASLGKMTNEELVGRKKLLERQLEDAEAKLKDKQEKLVMAREQMNGLLDRKADAQHKHDDIIRAINRDLPRYEDRVARDIQAAAWKIAVDESKDVQRKISEYAASLSQRPTALYSFEQAADIVFSGNFLNEMAQRGEEITHVATLLFLGYVDQATQFAQAYGGGGNGAPEGGWGKRPDEEDRVFMGKCLLSAIMMMRPPHRSQQLGVKPRR